MKKGLKLALGATAIGLGTAFYKMPLKDRVDMCSKGFVKVISKFSDGLPEPVVNSNSEEVVSVKEKNEE